MLTVGDIWFGVVLPGAISLVVLIAAWRPWRRGTVARAGHWGAPLALGTGLTIAYVGILGWPPFPPTDSTDWLFFLTFLLIAAGLVDALWESPAWVRGAICLLASSAVVCLILYPLLRNKGVLESVAWIVVLSIIVLLSWVALDRLAREPPGVAMPLVFLVVAASASIVLMLSGFKKFGHLGGALAATLGAGVLVACWSSRFSLARGGVLVFVVPLAGLLIGGLYAQLTALNAGLLFAAPFLAWVGQAPVAKDLSNRVRMLVALGLVLIPCGIALALAAIKFASEMSTDYPYY